MTPCKYCKSDATKGVIWADGRARIPVCDKHEAKARQKVKDNSDEVDKVTKMTAEELIDKYIGEAKVTFKDRGTGTLATVGVMVDGKAVMQVRKSGKKFHQVDNTGKATGKSWKSLSDIKKELS